MFESRDSPSAADQRRRLLWSRLATLAYRRRPLDYKPPLPSANLEPDGDPGPVDVIIPVYGAAKELEGLYASLLAATDLSYHRALFVVDGPQDSATETIVRRILAEGATTVIRNATRGGFVESVNRGLSGSQRDVVLLNSDTEVTRRWLQKLQRAAYSAPEIATATPFSNNATLCSIPRFLEANALPVGYDLEAFAELVERVSRRVYPPIPTGVGVCLYVKRKVLRRLGCFDHKAFGLGYGEESEFCMRALKAGYYHVLDDSTFIFHWGQRSFGSTRTRRVRKAHKTMRRRHPEYLPTIARFIREDPLASLRDRVLRELRGPRRRTRPPAPGSVLHLVHGWPPYSLAGTELYAYWLAKQQSTTRAVTAYARLADPARSLGESLELLDSGIRVRLVTNNFRQRNPLSRNAFCNRQLESDFDRLLSDVKPALVHVHHLAGHAVSLLSVAARRRIRVLFQLQDWWALCARSNLLDRWRRLCTGPGCAKCARCLPLTGLPPSRLWSAGLYAYRHRLMRRALALADGLVMGSFFLERSYREHGLLDDRHRSWVIPYGVDPAIHRDSCARSRRNGLPLRFAYIGSIMPHKGVQVAVEAFRDVPESKATLEVWGDETILPHFSRELRELARPDVVHFRGRFPEESKGAVLRSIDVLLAPSLGLESFGLVPREAMACGVPVIASRLGALQDMFQGESCGALVEPGSVHELREWIGRLIARPEQITEWSSRLPPVKSMEEHALEIDGVYEEILKR